MKSFCNIILPLGLMLLLLMQSKVAHAQIPDTVWTKTYGGTNYDVGRSVCLSADGCYVLAGLTQSFGTGNSDIYLVKTDQNGDTIWTKTYGGDSLDSGYSVQLTSDAGFIIVGRTASFGNGMADVWLVKTDSSGNLLWSKTFGGSSWDMGYSVEQTLDRGYIIAGETYSYGAGNSDIYLVKTDSIGETLWTKTYGGSGWDWGNSVDQTNDAGYIIAANTNSYGAGNSDFYLVKTDSLGDTLWTKTYGGTDADDIYDICQTTDNGYIITGYTYSFTSRYRPSMWLVKTDSFGNMIWDKTYGPEEPSIECAGYCVKQTLDNGYIAVGCIGIGPVAYDLYVMKTDSIGDSLWARIYGGGGDDVGSSIQESPDSGYIIAGSTTSYGAGDYDLWLLKMGLEGDILENIIGVPSGFLLTINNNPAKSTIFFNVTLMGIKQTPHFSLKIYDAAGQVIKQFQSFIAEHHKKIIWKGDDQLGKKVPTGIYFYNIEILSQMKAGKVVLIQ